METIILSAFLFFSLALIGYAFYNRKFIYLSTLTSFLLMVLGGNILSTGLDITYSGSYGFVANNSSALVGVITKTITYNDVYVAALGMFLVILGIMTLFLSFFYVMKGSDEENLVLEREE